MIDDIAIHVQNLPKRYRIGLKEKAHGTLNAAFPFFIP
jgi:hypothetical protein